MKKYELTEEIKMELDKTVHRIKYLIDIPMYGVKAGDLGGWLESEQNLSKEGNCCVLDNGCVTGHGCVTDNGSVSGNGCVRGHGYVTDNGYVTGNGCVSGDGYVTGNGCVSGHGRVTSSGEIATISGFGSENRHTTFYRTTEDDIGVTCGCFVGTLDEFREQVHETHGDTDIAREYLLAADLMERRFKRTSLWRK